MMTSSTSGDDTSAMTNPTKNTSITSMTPCVLSTATSLCLLRLSPVLPLHPSSHHLTLPQYDSQYGQHHPNPPPSPPKIPTNCSVYQYLPLYYDTASLSTILPGYYKTNLSNHNHLTLFPCPSLNFANLYSLDQAQSFQTNTLLGFATLFHFLYTSHVTFPSPPPLHRHKILLWLQCSRRSPPALEGCNPSHQLHCPLLLH